MNAFKAYKACVPVEWSSNLYITLVRGIPGTRRLHRRTLEALRLRKCNRTVVRWNTPTVRGMLQQVLKKLWYESLFIFCMIKLLFSRIRRFWLLFLWYPLRLKDWLWLRLRRCIKPVNRRPKVTWLYVPPWLWATLLLQKTPLSDLFLQGWFSSL